ncbi:MAG: ferrous iron transport protein A [Candidatus Margulisiibacteriota bacterium]|jgi:ferrous iron transport protein A
MITLADFKKNESGIITGILAEGEIKRRLLAMGIIKNTSFKIIRKAPLGDPIEISVKGFKLMMRKNEAKLILVKKID